MLISLLAPSFSSCLVGSLRQEAQKRGKLLAEQERVLQTIQEFADSGVALARTHHGLEFDPAKVGLDVFVP